jgi:hypothetical protein
VNIPVRDILQGHRLSEAHADYPAIRLNARWRVIACRDGIQWIIQYRNRAETVARSDWRGRSYCRTRDTLIRCCDAYCGEIDPIAAAILAALPERIPVNVNTATDGRAVSCPRLFA